MKGGARKRAGYRRLRAEGCTVEAAEQARAMLDAELRAAVELGGGGRRRGQGVRRRGEFRHVHRG